MSKKIELNTIPELVEDIGAIAEKEEVTVDDADVQAEIAKLLDDLIRQVYQHPQVHVSHGARITDTTGYVGNFVTTVRAEGRRRQLQHGAAILATGLQEHRPDEHLYGQDERVLTQLELEGLLHDGPDARLERARQAALHRLQRHRLGRPAAHDQDVHRAARVAMGAQDRASDDADEQHGQSNEQYFEPAFIYLNARLFLHTDW